MADSFYAHSDHPPTDPRQRGLFEAAMHFYAEAAEMMIRMGSVDIPAGGQLTAYVQLMNTVGGHAEGIAALEMAIAGLRDPQRLRMADAPAGSQPN